MTTNAEPGLAQEPTQRPPAGQPPLTDEQAHQLASQVPEWQLGPDRLERELRFRGFDEAMTFVNRVAAIAAAADHHPDIAISYNKVRLALSTHAIGGLSQNDFIVAARIDGVL